MARSPTDEARVEHVVRELLAGRLSAAGKLPTKLRAEAHRRYRERARTESPSNVVHFTADGARL